MQYVSDIAVQHTCVCFDCETSGPDSVLSVYALVCECLTWT
jgi:hypothetical protein